MNKDVKSTCCNADVKLANKNCKRGQTNYFVCTKCNKACDINEKIDKFLCFGGEKIKLN